FEESMGSVRLECQPNTRPLNNKNKTLLHTQASDRTPRQKRGGFFYWTKSQSDLVRIERGAACSAFTAKNKARSSRERRASCYCRSAVDSVIHQEAAQLLAAARMTQLAQRLRLYLSDALPSDVELLADLLEGVVGVH